MIFLIPVPAVIGAGLTYLVCKIGYNESAAFGANLVAPDKHIIEGTALGAAASLAVFGGAYSASLAPLRQAWGRTAARGATSASQTLQAQVYQQQQTQGPKQVKSFVQFWSDMAPSLLLHGQALSVAVVCAGFTKGAADAYLDETEGSSDTAKH